MGQGPDWEELLTTSSLEQLATIAHDHDDALSKLPKPTALQEGIIFAFGCVQLPIAAISRFTEVRSQSHVVLTCDLTLCTECYGNAAAGS